MKINCVITTEEYEKNTKHIKDKETKDRIKKQIKKLIENPEIGKPLRHDMKGERSVHIKPFRLVYAFENDKLILLRFEHRKEVYK
ncbi:MAG: type II toxin-antitoxin system RelE/ParE family toxin [Candidatus Aenigmatarchaeota archaeon]